jgi:O-succinylbenzoate synthase
MRELANSDLLGTLHGFELRRVRLPLVEPWRTAHGVTETRDVLLVRAVYEHAEGWGECVAMGEPTYSAEYTDGALDVLRRHLLPRILSGRPSSPEAVDALLRPVKGHPMAKAAIELAVLDAEGRASGRSLADLLGATRQKVTAGVALGLTDSISDLLDRVEQRVGEGYRRVKLKVTPGWDLEPVAAVRERFGDLLLQVDANGAYRLEDANHLKALDDFALLLIEQPLPEDDLAGHAALAAQLKTPLCLDESIVSAGSARTALTMGACRIINVKAGRVGGYVEAVRIHDACADVDVPVWCGGMLETGIGRVANLALAALPAFSLPGDLSPSDRYYREDIAEPVSLNPDGTIDVPDRPGIGAVLRTAVLDASTVERDWWPWRPG